MKKVLFIVGGLALVGGGMYFAHNVYIPKIKISNIDWNTKTVSFTIRGKKYVVKQVDGLASTGKVPFSKYYFTFEPNQLNTNDVYRLFISEGSTSLGQPIYIDFKNKTRKF